MMLAVCNVLGEEKGVNISGSSHRRVDKTAKTTQHSTTQQDSKQQTINSREDRN
jgi:hypothetical protein